ncbi:twin-arginine translocase TatA/TatE family subunit [Arthrobacter ginkgonis]|uniref:Twin-arginine translocase TatA/TatE family subunit n=1 Tax=Arthrobacter ginkgonis TaxID=1630594 RepID=A0ABP7BW18_9MICC
MFGINGGEFLVLAVLAVLILGPDKLPAYAQQLARLVKEVRRMAAGAKEQLREEVGDEIADIDWRKLDPRQYDPRKIIKDALLEDFDDAISAAKESPQPAAAQRSVATRQAERQLEPGEAAPFDSEAT